MKTFFVGCSDQKILKEVIDPLLFGDAESKLQTVKSSPVGKANEDRANRVVLVPDAELECRQD